MTSEETEVLLMWSWVWGRPLIPAFGAEVQGQPDLRPSSRTARLLHKESLSKKKKQKYITLYQMRFSMQFCFVVQPPPPTT